ncbi:MAG: hypothetical protein ACLR0P_13595 [Oscillospiraceae bacterium]
MEGWKGQVSGGYLAPYGLTYDQRAHPGGASTCPAPESGSSRATPWGSWWRTPISGPREQLAAEDPGCPRWR